MSFTEASLVANKMLTQRLAEHPLGTKAVKSFIWGYFSKSSNDTKHSEEDINIEVELVSLTFV